MVFQGQCVGIFAGRDIGDAVGEVEGNDRCRKGSFVVYPIDSLENDFVLVVRDGCIQRDPDFVFISFFNQPVSLRLDIQQKRLSLFQFIGILGIKIPVIPNLAAQEKPIKLECRAIEGKFLCTFSTPFIHLCTG